MNKKILHFNKFMIVKAIFKYKEDFMKGVNTYMWFIENNWNVGCDQKEAIKLACISVAREIISKMYDDDTIIIIGDYEKICNMLPSIYENMNSAFTVR